MINISVARNVSATRGKFNSATLCSLADELLLHCLGGRQQCHANDTPATSATPIHLSMDKNSSNQGVQTLTPGGSPGMRKSY